MCSSLMTLNLQSCCLVKCPDAWRDTEITLPPLNGHARRTAPGLMQLAPSWKFASKAVLPAFPERKALEEQLQEICPALEVSVKGEGPVMFFVMSFRLSLGSAVPLHFFEPRYRYMCRHLAVGDVFGFLNEGRGVHCGVTGTLCEVLDLSMNSNGTFDALIMAKSKFTLAEVWLEAMPRGQPLAVGFIRRADAPPEPAPPAPRPGIPGAGSYGPHPLRCLRGWRWLRCRR
eukprot:Skav231255  [mRNA]  locus=scaffold411:622954:626559:- [translate_table: standard]